MENAIGSKRDIVVIGASAGGVPALTALFQSLNGNLRAAIFVVLHVRPTASSFLPTIIQKQTSLPVAHAVDGEPVRTGRVYIAPPDRHLVIESGHLHLNTGPRENRTRPAINPLFRSAAMAYGPRVIGMILSGALDDGTAGLWEIKRRGGVAIVQSPADAEHPEMPESAIAHVEIDYELPVAKMRALLKSLAETPAMPSRLGTEESVMSEATKLTCPDCRGPIERLHFDQLTEYRCRVGHAFGPQNMLAAHQDLEESVLWSAIESLEEGADLIEELGKLGNGHNASESAGDAEAKRTLAKAIRAGIEQTRSKRTESAK
jgi:two-component system, chemotaxis family, protein-glutamate methylesterase/glutaminase